MTHRSWIVLALLAAVARGASGQVVLETDDRGRDIVRNCHPTAWPKKLPALSAVVDSAALWTALGAAAPADSGTILFSIIYRLKEAPIIRVLEPETPSPFAVSLSEVVGGALRVLGPPEPRALRLRVRPGAAATARIERSVYCPPQPTGEFIWRTSTRVRLERGDRLPTGRTAQLEAQWTVTALGNMANLQVIRGSGIRELDESIFAGIQQRAYRPALLDGLRVASWVRSNGRMMKP